ncbi:MAG: hypothetical protein V2I97_08870 [Desulfococcaceae bacterium]|jgi:putative CRISPR-associated protein (TIGR02619 family)|nr:hypothetical protein [Desulfococcaceae bacterium]
MTTHFIVSVGTSILKKYKEKSKKDLQLKQGGHLPDSVPKPPDICTDYQAKVKILKNPLCRGAEEKSILKVVQEKELNIFDCHFHFICTATLDCIFCASYLGHEVFKEGKITCYLPQGLGKADDDRFVTEGVPALLSEMVGILNEAEKKDGDEVIIIPTGGYKAIIPYLTIAGILYKRPIYYIYEDSEKPLNLPAPPLGVNTTEFRSALVLLENIVDSDEAEAKPYLAELDEGFQKLTYKDGNGKYRYTAFGERLKKMFHDQPVSPFAVRVTGNKIISRLGNKYEPLFREMTKLGETVWIGDKAPEMADHARYHHVNLLAYTELLLSPILQDDKDFLSEAELFLLLGMVYLHDCGHARCIIPVSSDKKTQVPLLPTEIRNFHNLLGYLRMTDDNFLASLKRQGLTGINGETLENIATLSLYHRKKMSLRKGCYKGTYGKEFIPLKDCSIVQNGDKIRGELLLALFRIIDGMDKQIGRAGDAVEISMRAEAILSDLVHLKARIDRLNQMVDSIPDKDATQVKRSVEEELKNLFKDYIQKEAVSSGKDDAVPSCRCEGYGKNPECKFQCLSPPDFTESPKYIQFEDALIREGLQKYLPMAWEYLEAKVAFMFRALQPTYYYSDLLLTMPKVTHTVNNGKRHITVNYRCNPDETVQKRIETIWDEIKKWITENNLGYPENAVITAELDKPEKIVDGFRDEYCRKEKKSWVSEVAQILYDNGITIEFQFEGKTVGCWQISGKK